MLNNVYLMANIPKPGKNLVSSQIIMGAMYISRASREFVDSIHREARQNMQVSKASDAICVFPPNIIGKNVF